MRTGTKFVQSTLRKIVATRYFGWASPQTPLGELIMLPQTTYLDLRGPTSKEREGKEREGEKRGRGGEDVCSRNFQFQGSGGASTRVHKLFANEDSLPPVIGAHASFTDAYSTRSVPARFGLGPRSRIVLRPTCLSVYYSI